MKTTSVIFFGIGLLACLSGDSLSAQSIVYNPRTVLPSQGNRGVSFFGISVSGTGDVNGDNVPDYIVGAPGLFAVARVHSGIDDSILYDINGSQQTFFGSSVSGAGDVNGDGLADVIVGAPRTGLSNEFDDSNNGLNSGSVFVVTGEIFGRLATGITLYNFNGQSSTNPPNQPVQLGASVSAVGVLRAQDVNGNVLNEYINGDVNGDGFDDFIVGAPFDSSNGDLAGSVRVHSGSDGSLLFKVEGDSAFDLIGRSVSGAGDVNGDGTPDFIVGLSGGGPSGSARVLSGSDGALIHTFVGDIPFTGINFGPQSDLFGESVSGAGDVNGDGFDDVIVGAWADDNIALNLNGSGSARVFSGIDGTALYTFEGTGAGEGFGESVSGAGDVNRDGFDDVIVGAFNATIGNAASIGRVRIFSGFNGRLLHTFTGDNRGDQFGNSVSCLGDLNADGLADFIVGAPGGSPPNSSGYARIFVSETLGFLLGDVNQDGVVSFTDIAPFIAILSNGNFLAEADINRDGVVNFLDITLFIELLSS